MAKVTGVGGIFFRAMDPAALTEWYHTHLGITPTPTDPTGMPWIGEGGVTVFAPFAADTDYFPAERQFMLNFRVASMDDMLTDLRAAGIEILREDRMDGIGRFARITDPEGNHIELWEPEAPAEN